MNVPRDFYHQFSVHHHDETIKIHNKKLNKKAHRQKVPLKSFLLFHFVFQPFVVHSGQKFNFVTFFPSLTQVISSIELVNTVDALITCSKTIYEMNFLLLLFFSHPFFYLLILLTKLKLFKIPIKKNTTTNRLYLQNFHIKAKSISFC